MPDRNESYQSYSGRPPPPIATNLSLIFLPQAIFKIVFVGLIAGVLGGVLGAAGGMSDTQPPVFFSLGDTRIVPLPFNSFFCSELTLEVDTVRAGASVYLITDTRPLTDKNSFTFSTDLITQTYRYWRYYLYPGSNFSTSVRVIIPLREGIFYLIKGHSNFQQFVDNPQTQPNGVLDSFSIPCITPYTRQLTFQVQEEDDYYFIYQAGQICNSRNTLFASRVRISVSRFLYSTAGLTNAPQCSAVANGQCSLSVPNDPNYCALIVTDTPTDNNWEGNINIRLLCSSTRGWAYAVVVLVPLLLVVGVIITTVILLVVCCWRKRDSLRATCCRRHNTQTTTTEAAPTSAVELQEMDRHTGNHSLASPDQKDSKVTGDSLNNGQQHLTAAPPPSYKDSLDYPTQQSDLPPPYYSI